MGLFDFIKNAGKKLGIGGDDDAPDVSAVTKELASHDLGTDKVDIAVAGDTVVLKGEVKDQSAFEKAIIAVGNTLGVSKVEAGELKIVEAPGSAAKPRRSRNSIPSRKAIIFGRLPRPNMARARVPRTPSSSRRTSRC